MTRREHILSEAAKIIRAQGYAGATMRDIAEAVGIEVSSLYNHIRSKQEILSTICFAIGREYIMGLEQILNGSSGEKDMLNQIIHLHIDLASRHKDSMQVFEEEWKHLQDDDLEQFRSMRTYYERRLMEFFDGAIRCGHFRNVETRVLLYTFLSSLKWLNFYFRENKSYELETLRKNMADLLCHGILNETK